MSGGKSLNTLFTLDLICGFVFSTPKNPTIPPHFHTSKYFLTPNSLQIWYGTLFHPLRTVYSCNAHRNIPHFNTTILNYSIARHRIKVRECIISNYQLQSSIIKWKRATKQTTSNSLCFTLKVVFVYNITHRHRLFLLSIFLFIVSVLCCMPLSFQTN